MKYKSLFTVLFSLALYPLVAQCKVNNDPITNEKVVSYNYYDHEFYFERKNNVSKFEILWTYPSQLKMIVPKGTEMLFKLGKW